MGPTPQLFFGRHQCSTPQPPRPSSSSTQRELLVAAVTIHQATVSLRWLWLAEWDLRGSDLENMSLSKRFLQEGRKEKLAGMEGTSVRTYTRC